MPQVYVTPGGVPTAVSGTDIGCRVKPILVTSTILPGITAILGFDGEDYDTDNMHDNVIGISRITINTAGKYQIASFIEWIWDTAPLYGRNQLILNAATGFGGGSTAFGAAPNPGDNFNAYNFTRGLRVFAVADFVDNRLLNVAPGGGTIVTQLSTRYWARKVDVAVDISVVVRRSASKSIVTGTDTLIDYDLEDFDTDTMHDNAVNNTRLTVQTTGKYEFWLMTQFAANVTGSRDGKFFLNGVTVIGGITGILQEAGSAITMNSAIQGSFVAADYVEHQVSQSSGGALDFAVGSRFGAIKNDHWG